MTRGGNPVTRRSVLATLGTFAGIGCLGETDGDDEVFAYGDIDVVVDGEPVDLSADRFQAEYADDYAIEFHLHDFDDYWYMEGDRYVTVAEGIDLLPEMAFAVEDDDIVYELDGDRFDEATGDTIEVTVDDEPVDPAAYVLQHGDHVIVDVTTA